MYRDERDALSYRAELLEKEARESKEKLAELQSEKERTERTNQQLRKQLSSLGPKPPFWKRAWRKWALALAFAGLGVAVYHWLKPHAQLTWRAKVVSAQNISLRKDASCTIETEFSRRGALKVDIESVQVFCDGVELKNTLYPFGGEGWILLEEQNDHDLFQYRLEQSSGDLIINTSEKTAKLTSKKNQNIVIEMEVEALSEPRRGEAFLR